MNKCVNRQGCLRVKTCDLDQAQTGVNNTYGYDANGNQTTRTIDGVTLTLAYDAEGHLISVTGPAITATFIYDGDGKRVRSTINGVTTAFVGNHYEVQGSTITKYYYAGSQRVAMKVGSTVYYLLSDHLGSTSLTTDSSGNLVSEMRYSAWGSVRDSSGSTPTNYTYTGQYSDSYINLLDYGSRRYDPETGRFISTDTIIPGPYNSQAWDRYSYTFNNPVRYVDPDGHDPILIALLLIAAGSFILTACAPETPTPRQAEIQKFIDNQDYQGAIDKAVELYDINTNDVYPTYKPDLEDATGEVVITGGTIVESKLVGGTAELNIGSLAFSSPDQLVDTLAHEAVHTQQFAENRWYANRDGKILMELEGYDSVLSRQDELELSKSVIDWDKTVRREYFKRLSPSLKENVRKGIYILPE